MKIDSECSLICDMSKLENHLIQPSQQNSEQQNYSQHDVTELTVFLTKRSNKTPNSLYEDIRVSLDNSTVNDVTQQAAAVFYINPEELVRHHPHILRMILQCLSSEDRVRLLHIDLIHGHTLLQRIVDYDNGITLLHMIAQYDKTGETMKTVLELFREDQYYHLLSVKTRTFQNTPLHRVCLYNNSAAVIEVIMRQVTSKQTRYKLLQIPSSQGWTLLHEAAWYNATQSIRIIADSESSHHLIHLLTITDEWGRTPVQLAAGWGRQETVKLLQKYYTTANLIVRALQQTDYTGK